MSMSPLMWPRIYSSTVAGGGVLGEVIGIVRGVMMQVGPTIEMSRPFTGGYIQVGGMITGNIDGRDNHGIINEFRTSNFSRTGEAGNRTGIGNGSSTGVFLVCAPSRSLNIRRGIRNCNRIDRSREGMSDRGKHSSSTSRKQGRSGRGVHTSSMEGLKMEKRNNSGEGRLPEV